MLNAFPFELNWNKMGQILCALLSFFLLRAQLIRCRWMQFSILFFEKHAANAHDNPLEKLFFFSICLYFCTLFPLFSTIFRYYLIEVHFILLKWSVFHSLSLSLAAFNLKLSETLHIHSNGFLIVSVFSVASKYKNKSKASLSAQITPKV